ncbi:MAG: DNA translocase FtsK [Chloroflexota bacterium]|jgi:S-DNA-T family DNA segregation ATPase FtsK/SpoIIIE
MARQKTAAGGRSTSERRGTPGSDKAGKQAPQGQKPRRGESQRARPQGKAASSKAPASRPAGRQAPARKSKPPAAGRARVRPTIQKRASLAQQVRQWAGRAFARATDPGFWRGMAQQLPPWVDELGALLLIVLGVVTLNALLNTSSEAPLAITLSRVLRQVSGHAAYAIALGLMLAGVVVLMPKFGRTVRVGWERILAFELGFAALAALLHLAANDPEPRVLASEGEGGGYLGWLLTALLSRTGMGRLLMEVFFFALLVASAILLLRLRVQHLLLAVQWVRAQLERSLNRLGDPDEHGDASPLSPEGGGNPAARGGADDPGALDDDPPDPPPTQDRLAKTEQQDSAQTRDRSGAANGRSLVSPGGPGERESLVPRGLPPNNGVRGRIRRVSPDAEGGRTFTVDDFREVKKVGKRDPNLPPLDLLSDLELNIPTAEEINTNARIIRHTLLEFDVETEVVDVKVGPTVTLYAVSPLTEQLTEDGERVVNRVRVSEITNLNGDLALALSARRLRIQAPVPGESYVGVEVPNRQPSTVALRPVLESETFYRHRHRPLALPLGRDTSGAAFVADLGTMPHLLIAGTTGSGKSIMLAAMTTALVMNNTPDRVRLVLLDPKMVELSRFNGLPHLLGPVETELDRIIGVLRWATREMDRRYRLLEQEAARNIHVYNAALGRKRAGEHLPYIVIIIDEIGDLMMQRPDETERALTRLAQMARAVGIHLMVATQRPSVDVITGLIKANFPARISFAVASGIDSRVILDTSGAETLMGRGDMLFLAPDAAGPQRIQGCYVSDEEVGTVVEYWRQWHEQQIAAGALEPVTIGPWERGMTRREVLAETDPMLEEAITLVIEAGEASASLIQRRLGLGYPRAARIVDLLHELGIVGEPKPGGRTRDVLVKPGTDPFEGLVDKRLKGRE